jgi:hypothetical protein
MLAWLVIGPLLGLVILLVLRAGPDSWEPPRWLGFAIGGVVCLAIEAALT